MSPTTLVLAGHDGGEIDADRPGADPVVGGAARQMRGIGARDQGLGRRAADIDAGSAEQLALDDRDRLARRREPAGHRRAGLAGPDDDRVEVGGSSERQDDDEAENDRADVLDDGGRRIAPESLGHPCANLGAAVGPDHGADHPGDKGHDP